MDWVFPDIPRTYTAIAEWAACIVFIANSRKRISGFRLALLCAAALAFQITFLFATSNVPLVYWIPCMLAAVLAMFFFIWICCDVSPLVAGYSTVRAFLLAEFAAAFVWQFSYYTYNVLGSNEFAHSRIIMLIFYSLFFFSMFYFEKKLKKGGELVISSKDFFGALVISAAVFAISNISISYSNTPFSATMQQDKFVVRTLMNLAGLVLLYTYHIQRGDMQAKRELAALNNVLQNQYVQYQQSRESIDLINRKYHDLKHQLQALRAEPDAERRGAYLDEIERDIKTYEAQNKTGNPVLDTILTGKSLYCQKHGISLTGAVDGSLLAHMDTMDICSLFGNALENAIECVMKISEREKRLIAISVSRQKSFVLICFENYCEEELKLANGLPVTTKSDIELHGYGLKSIAATARKYSGTYTVKLKDNWFTLRILLPAEPENKKEA